MAGSERETTVESRIAYQGKILSVRVDQVRMASGRLATREVVEHSEVVCIVPIDADGNVLMVRQYRKPAETTLLEIPAGGVDPGEAADQAALRELQEETGFTTDNLEHLMNFWATPGFCDEFMHAYLARGLRQGSPEHQPDSDEEIQEVVRVPLYGTPEMIQRGEIRDAKSIASLLMALRIMEQEELDR
jgi:ADP-ribose pyrophosphatase